MNPAFLFTGIYLILLFAGLPKIAFVRKSGLNSNDSRILFIFKIIAGFVCAWYFSNIFVNADYLGHNREGRVEYELLLTNPGGFFTEFNSDINKYGLGGVFDTAQSFWGYLRFTLLFKILAMMNFITGGNFYLNAAVFSSIIYFGHLAFFRIYNDLYPSQKLLKILVCFCIPSLVLYTSCAHKDGFVFLALGISSYIFYDLLKNNRTTIWKVLAFVAAIVMIFLFRNYVLVALLPAMGIAFITGKVQKHKTFVAAGMFMLAALVFFATGKMEGSLNLPAAVVKRKADFALLEKGTTDLAMKELKPGIISFAENIPLAINHVLLRPYPGEFTGSGIWLASLELYFYLAILVLFIFRKRKELFTPVHTFNIYGISFFVIMLIIIGLTIPNAGAIVRYRSLLWIFILCPIAGNISPRLKR